MPAPSADIALAAKLASCKAIRDIVAGIIKEWTNFSDAALEAKAFLVKNARFLAAHTKHKGLLGGLKFTEKMAPAQCLNKALKLMGLTTFKHRQSVGHRVMYHRIASQKEEAMLIKMKNDDSILKSFKIEMETFRNQTRSALNAAVDSQLQKKLAVWADKQNDVEAVLEELRRRHPDLNSLVVSNQGDALPSAHPPCIFQSVLARIDANNSPPPGDFLAA